MKETNVRPEDLAWRCMACDREMEIGPVTVEYMGHRFTVDLARCPGCGRAMVSEDLAMGKMAEVEQILEDK